MWVVTLECVKWKNNEIYSIRVSWKPLKDHRWSPDHYLKTTDLRKERKQHGKHKKLRYNTSFDHYVKQCIWHWERASAPLKSRLHENCNIELWGTDKQLHSLMLAWALDWPHSFCSAVRKLVLHDLFQAPYCCTGQTRPLNNCGCDVMSAPCNPHRATSTECLLLW